MEIPLTLKNMSTSEKLLMLEHLWDDLQRNPSDLPSPAWHKDILNARAQRLRKNETKFVDWPLAKEQIRNKIK